MLALVHDTQIEPERVEQSGHEWQTPSTQYSFAAQQVPLQQVWSLPQQVFPSGQQ
jgi:hypothetical protein